MNELNTISGRIDTLSVSLEGVNDSMLDSLEAGLMGISTELSEGDENLSSDIGTLLQRIGEYRSDTNGRIQNVSDLMATMQELQALSDTADKIETDLDTLNALQTGVGDIQKEQEDATSSLSLNTILLIIAIVLQIALIIIGAILMMRRRGSGGFPQE
jgi:ABC-type transporter Mla subunit MlaD